jgi:O-antigen/teichoic acid export membrane protein
MLMILSKGVSHGCFLLVAVVLARSLDRPDFGTFNQVWLVNRSLLYLFALGLPVSVYYFLPRLSDARIKSFIVQTMLTLTILALPFSISMYFLADQLSIYFNNPALADYLRLFSIYPLITLPTVSTDAILIALGRTRSAAVFEMSTKAVMILAVAAAGIFGQRLDLVFKALVGYGIAQSVLGVWMVWQPVRKLTSQFSFADLSSQIKFAVPYGLATLAGALNYQVDKVLVAVFHPPAIFALYAAGAFEIPLAGVTSVPVISVMMGELTRRFDSGDTQGFLQLWHQSMVKLALPVFAIAAFLMVFAEQIVVGLFSSEYSASVWPFRIFLLFVPLRITILEQVLATLGETRFVFKAQGVAMIVNIVLGYMLIRNLGWLGAAASAVVTGYLFATLVILEIRDRLRVSLSRVVPWQELARVFLVAILAAAGSLPVAFLPVGLAGKVGAGFVVYTTIYLIGNLKTNSITAADLKTLWGWLSLSARSSIGNGALESGPRK